MLFLQLTGPHNNISSYSPRPPHPRPGHLFSLRWGRVKTPPGPPDPLAAFLFATFRGAVHTYIAEDNASSGQANNHVKYMFVLRRKVVEKRKRNSILNIQYTNNTQMSFCRPTATEQCGVTSTYICATHVKLSSAVLPTLPTPPKPTTLPMMPIKLAKIF
jgi:hypothetical protein